MNELYPKINPLGTLTDAGTIKMPNGTDPLNISYTGIYWCDVWLEGAIPQSSTYCIVEVIATNDVYRKVTAHYPSLNKTFTNYLNNGVWRGWKLTEGQIALWAGEATEGQEINLSMDAGMFNSFEVTLRSLGNARSNNVRANGNDVVIFCDGGIVSASGHCYSSFVVLSAFKKIATINTSRMVDLSAPALGTANPIIAIYGKP